MNGWKEIFLFVLLCRVTLLIVFLFFYDLGRLSKIMHEIKTCKSHLSLE